MYVFLCEIKNRHRSQKNMETAQCGGIKCQRRSKCSGGERQVAGEVSRGEQKVQRERKRFSQVRVLEQLYSTRCTSPSICNEMRVLGSDP